MKIIHLDKSDVSEVNDANKTSKPKKSDTCHYWYLLDKGFKFQLNVCIRCHDLLMMYSVILNIKQSDYFCISKIEAINSI